MTVPSGTGALEATQQQVLTQLQAGTAVSGSVTANAGTNLNTSLLALETGGNLASAKADLDTIVTQTSGLATQTTLAAAKSDLDTIVTQTATPNVSDRWARQVGQVDLARVLGATLSQSNPVITESNIQNWMRNGQAFTANGRGVTATNTNLLNCALSIFNPSNSGKNILVYSLKCIAGATGGTVSQWNLTTSDPGGGTGITAQITPVRLPGATSPSTIASVYQTANSNANTVAAPGTKVEEFLISAGISAEILSNNVTILLPPGNGLAVMLFISTVGSYFQTFAKWIEY